jgi:hypothetical protein
MVSAQESMPNQNCQLNLQKPRIFQTFKCRSVVITDIILILVASKINLSYSKKYAEPTVFYTGVCSL